jgi:hypothetical protein
MDLNIKDLGILISQAQKQAEDMMNSLSKEDQQKANDIVNGIDKTNLNEMKTYLKKQRDARD